MTSADWRALIEAYLDGRLSAEAFMRRFVEAWESGAPLPRPIVDLQVAVEAFEAAVRDAGEEGAVSDEDLRQAAQRARGLLGEQGDPPPRTFDRERAREDMRRFSVQMSGCLGVGCLLAAIWIGLSLLQVYYVSEFIQASTNWGAWPSAVVGFFLAFVPLIGNVLAFAGATQEGWPTWAAAIVFFAAPAATLFSGWSRLRRSGT